MNIEPDLAQPQDDFKRSLAYAEFAIRRLRSSRLSLQPRNYEVWYVYATEEKPELKRAIDETLARSGDLTASELSQIYDAYLAYEHTDERLDQIGSRALREIESVLRAISDGVDSATGFGVTLEAAGRKLDSNITREQIQDLIRRLATATQGMKTSNRSLEERLRASIDEIASLHRVLEAIRSESLTDPLTGLGNRKKFDSSLTGAVERARSSGEPLSLLMLDIDKFKVFNDLYGHLTGDQVLRLVGHSLKQSTKGRDVAARYGGEEFAVILPDTTLHHGIGVAESFRRAISAKELTKRSTGEILGRVTVSIGVAGLLESDDAETLIERADCCLYAAKRNGRNRVISEVDFEYLKSSQSSARRA
jgi:diguanylate cyclase